MIRKLINNLIFTIKDGKIYLVTKKLFNLRKKINLCKLFQKMLKKHKINQNLKYQKRNFQIKINSQLMIYKNKPDK